VLGCPFNVNKPNDKHAYYSEIIPPANV